MSYEEEMDEFFAYHPPAEKPEQIPTGGTDQLLQSIARSLSKQTNLLQSISSSLETIKQSYSVDVTKKKLDTGEQILTNAVITVPAFDNISATTGYTQINVYTILNRLAQKLYVYNLGPGTLYMRKSSDGQSFSESEHVVFESDKKIFDNVYELRIRTTVPNTKYIITEFEQERPKDVSFLARQRAISLLDKLISPFDSNTTNNISGVTFLNINLALSVGLGTAANSAALRKYNGLVWDAIPVSPFGIFADTRLNAVSVGTVVAAFAVGVRISTGNARIIRYDPATDAQVSDPQNDTFSGELLSIVNVENISRTIAVGQNLLILVWDGVTWTQKVAPSSVASTVDLLRVAFDSSNNIWACGESGTLIKSIDNGETWNQVSTSPTINTTINLRGLDFSPTGDFGFVVGDNGNIFKITPSLNKVEAFPSGLPNSSQFILRDIDIISNTSAWVIGDNGTILYYDGVEFLPFTTSTDRDFRDIDTSSETNLSFAVGLNGLVNKFSDHLVPVVTPGVTPLREEYSELHAIVNQAFTASGSFSGTYPWRISKYMTVLAVNTHDQPIVITITGLRNISGDAGAIIGSFIVPAFNLISALGTEARTISIDSHGWLPFVQIMANANTAPTTGNINVFLFFRN